MFNMGGPIKQGIMDGIREPYAGGGPTGTGLVGDQRYPKTGGREHHGFMIPPILMGIATAARAAAPWAARTGARFLPKIKRMFGTTTPGSVTKGTKFFGKTKAGKKDLRALIKGDPKGEIVGAHQAVTMNPSKFNPNWLGGDPTVRLVGGAAKSIFNPTVGGWAAKGARLAASPTVIIGGLIYGNGRWFNKKGEELDPNSTEVANAKAKGGGKDYGPYTKGAPTITAAMREEKAKADKEKRINALLDTMGYDKARKNAAYDALIDAGRMVSERGTLDPKNIGRELIDPIVAATSARFDKPEQIREAVGLMQVKADIQKEMTKDETELANKVKRMNLRIGEKTLAGDSFKDILSKRSVKGEAPTGEDLAHILRTSEGIDAIVLPIKTPQGTDTLAHVTEVIKETWSDPELPKVEPGYYVVSNRVIIVDEAGNVTPYH
jgi:hypothetical protein